MTVDPHRVAAIPMSRHPAPISSTRPVARPVGIIRLIADIDADTNRIRRTCECAHAEQSSEKQSKFFHSCLLRLDLDGSEPALFNHYCASENLRPGPARSQALSIFRARELNPLTDLPPPLPEC